MTKEAVDLFALPVAEDESPSITLRRLEDLTLLVVDHPEARAAITLQGAQLIAWQPTAEEPVLWLSGESAFAEGKAVRGGIPVCWPWFANAGTPAHGFARTSPWTLTAHEEGAESARLTLTLRSGDETRALWPHDFTLTARFTLGRRCEITLTAEGDHTSTGALHSYFHVGASDRVHVSGLGDHYHDKVADAEGTQTGDVTFPDRLDRIFTNPEPVARLHDPALNRTVEIHHHDASDAVAWNPGPELAREMSDVPDDGYENFVCVETARINRPLVATPTTAATLGVTLSISRG